jgi:NAD+ synthase (glutamine-hydrolysing)
MILPNYGVFDEHRVFKAGTRPLILQIGPARVGIHVCEDSWQANGAPRTLLGEARLDLLVNVSASPYHRGKLPVRKEVLRKTGGTVNAPVAYCNLVGGQDELVFDGASLVIDRDGRVRAQAASFREELLLFTVPVSPEPPPPERLERYDLVRIEPPRGGRAGLPPGDAREIAVRRSSVAEPPEDLEAVYTALTLGLHDYVEKNGFSRALVALSGGIDSALVATLAVDALGPDRVVGVTMPSVHSSRETIGDAGRLAENLGIRLHTVPIKDLVAAYDAVLSPLWEGRPPDTTEENLQARIRGTIIMAISNKFGWLVLATGNKSELATGYCTLYGDMVGGFAVIKDVPKTLVFALARWRNERAAPRVLIPPSTIQRPPSAELKPDQRDTDSLPPYEELDPILERYIEQDKGLKEIVAAGCDPETAKRVIRMTDLNEYKRRQGPPGIKITPKAFGRDRRLPITNRYRENGGSAGD